jgi:hypothetical protein
LGNCPSTLLCCLAVSGSSELELRMGYTIEIVRSEHIEIERSEHIEIERSEHIEIERSEYIEIERSEYIWYRVLERCSTRVGSGLTWKH